MRRSERQSDRGGAKGREGERKARFTASEAIGTRLHAGGRCLAARSLNYLCCLWCLALRGNALSWAGGGGIGCVGYVDVRLDVKCGFTASLKRLRLDGIAEAPTA